MRRVLTCRMVMFVHEISGETFLDSLSAVPYYLESALSGVEEGTMK